MDSPKEMKTKNTDIKLIDGFPRRTLTSTKQSGELLLAGYVIDYSTIYAQNYRWEIVIYDHSNIIGFIESRAMPDQNEWMFSSACKAKESLKNFLGTSIIEATGRNDDIH